MLSLGSDALWMGASLGKVGICEKFSEAFSWVTIWR